MNSQSPPQIRNSVQGEQESVANSDVKRPVTINRKDLTGLHLYVMDYVQDHFEDKLNETRQ